MKVGGGVKVFLVLYVIVIFACVIFFLNETGVVDIKGSLDTFVSQSGGGNDTQVAYAWRTIKSDPSHHGLNDIKLFTFFKREGARGVWNGWENVLSFYYQFPVIWR